MPDVCDRLSGLAERCPLAFLSHPPFLSEAARPTCHDISPPQNPTKHVPLHEFKIERNPTQLIMPQFGRQSYNGNPCSVPSWETRLAAATAVASISGASKQKVLLEPKALGILYGCEEAVPHLFLCQVLWEQEDVEARVAGGEAIRVGAASLDDEGELAEAPDRSPVAPCGEQKEPLLLLKGQRVQNLKASDATQKSGTVVVTPFSASTHTPFPLPLRRPLPLPFTLFPAHPAEVPSLPPSPPFPSPAIPFLPAQPTEFTSLPPLDPRPHTFQNIRTASEVLS